MLGSLFRFLGLICIEVNVAYVFIHFLLNINQVPEKYIARLTKMKYILYFLQINQTVHKGTEGFQEHRASARCRSDNFFPDLSP
jgi:hypothetical protein